MAGYSHTPLAKKLGIKPGTLLRLIDAPAYYLDLFADFPADVTVVDDQGILKVDLIHFFAADAAVLQRVLPTLKERIVQNGIIWVSWPKKASKMATDVNETLVHTLALSCGLVDIKVCAVDETWSGLKLVIPVRLRI